MKSKSRVLVVGTTADYIEWIRRTYPDVALFLTDRLVRQNAQEPEPSGEEELLCDLNDYGQVLSSLKNHLQKWDICLDGVACFDCESMELSAELAQRYSLPYPDVETIRNCRDKYLSKLLWQQNNIRCPVSRIVGTPDEADAFFNLIKRPCVMKPLTGSGSELVFRCDSREECRTAFAEIQKRLQERRSHRLYKSNSDSVPSIIIEEHVSGSEYSCDFIIDNGRAEVIRLTKKIQSPRGPFGTIRGYIIEASLPEEIEEQMFERILLQGAEALGIRSAICMADFMLCGREVALLEMTPRPGGDCLPFLLRHSMNLDILKLNLDFARHILVKISRMQNQKPCAGLRLHAGKCGVLVKIDAQNLSRDPRVLEIHLPRHQGHIVRIPPDDYESWLLGHIIFRPDKSDLENQFDELINQIKVEMK
ncbi:MAG: ATP-grasp domain-containing protein [Nitrospirae bacterium]|nr:ATP-grasp domain-containing protein [Nitrospirota bacterium]